jgi:hypothetical protein
MSRPRQSTKRLADFRPAPWPALTRRERDAEALAIHFGLGYLSAQGIANLAKLLTWTCPLRWNPPDEMASAADLIKPPPERIG